MLITKICNRCECEYEGGRRAKYCPTCRMEINRQQAKDRNLASMGGKSNAARYAKKTTKKQKKVKQGICDSSCKGCVFLQGEGTNLLTCSYWDKMDKLRPCPAGNGCTAKMTTKQYIAYKKRQAKVLQIMTIKCHICGKEFETTDRRRRNCSSECLQISRNRASKAQAKRLSEARIAQKG